MPKTKRGRIQPTRVRIIECICMLQLDHRMHQQLIPSMLTKVSMGRFDIVLAYLLHPHAFL